MSARRSLRPRAGTTATALFLAGLALSAAASLSPSLVGAARAQTVESRRDQPTPATLPSESDMRQREGDRPIAQVAPPEAITSSTAVLSTDRRGKTSYTNPLDHLPARDRAGTGGGRRE